MELNPRYVLQKPSCTAPSPQAHACGRVGKPRPSVRTVLAQRPLWVGGVRHSCQTYATLTGGAISSEMFGFPPPASAASSLGASADDTGGSGGRRTPALILTPQLCAARSTWDLLFPGLCASSIHQVPQCLPPLPRHWQYFVSSRRYDMSKQHKGM